MAKNTKHGLTIRGDSLYCPLSFSFDAYWNCLTNCYNCYFRHLNHVWGKELRPSSPQALEKKLQNGLKNKAPKSVLAWAIKHKKTIRVGNKADPFQKEELKKNVTKKALKVLHKLKWTYVIQTRFTSVMVKQSKEDILNNKDLVTIMPVISPGLDRDWEEFERKRTTPPTTRLKHLKYFQNKGINCGVNGEPFIPGVHTTKDFENALKLLKSFGIKSYNTYNFHFNHFVAKKLHAHTSVDIEKIWYYNQDKQWKPILQKLIALAKKYEINLGCPDFVNTGKNYIEPANTCCGVEVPNPCTYNTHFFKQLAQKGEDKNHIPYQTFDGVGNFDKGIKVIEGKTKEFYTLKDAGWSL